MAGGGADRAGGARRDPHPTLLPVPVPGADRHSSRRPSPRHNGGGHPRPVKIHGRSRSRCATGSRRTTEWRKSCSRKRLLRGMARGIATVGAAARRRRGAAVPSAGGWGRAVAGGGARGGGEHGYGIDINEEREKERVLVPFSWVRSD
jgi:hypothetical protein